MAFGIRIRDANGNVILDTSMRSGFIVRILDISTNNQSGSVNEPGLAEGQPFYFLESQSVEAGPTVTFNGTQISWQSTNQSVFWGGRIYVGVR